MTQEKIDEFSVRVSDAVIYVNKNLHLERSALAELDQFSKIEGIQHLAFTPDFHKGSGTPIGTVALMDRVYPRVTGNDIGCGMRLDVLDGIRDLQVTDELIARLRHTFFEGRREVLVKDRSEILAYGLLASLYGRSTAAIPFNDIKAHAGGALGQAVFQTFLSHIGT